MRDRRLLHIDSHTHLASLVDSVAPDLLDAVLPSSVEGLLTSALDQLDADCQMALKLASVVGRRFSLSLVAALSPIHCSLSQLHVWMAAAKEQHVITECVQEVPLPEVDSWYSFTHQLLRDAAYSSLLYHQRRVLHSQLAEHLANSVSTERSASRDRHTLITATYGHTRTHVLAQHYWLAVCDANNVLIHLPDQRLLECAMEWLLPSAQSSLSLGALDTGCWSLIRAIRCVRCLQHDERREQWELRLLSVIVCSHVLVSNGPVLLVLAIEAALVQSKSSEVEDFTLVCRAQCAVADRP